MHAVGMKRRQLQSFGKRHVMVTQNGERQMQTLRHLLLVLGGLCAQAKHLRTEFGEFIVMVFVRCVLRRAAARTGNLIPPRRQGYAGLTGHGVTVNDHISA